MPTAPHLSNLPPDVVFSIFAQCDVASVVSTGRTCRYFHRLALEKSVWIRLVRDLQRRGILDTACCPDITALSVTGLMQLIKLAVLGPETWSRGHVPEVSKQVSLQPTTGFDKTSVGEAELLPSGRYVLLLKSMVLECWDVAEERALWTRSFAEGVELTSSLRFAAEEMNGGTSVIIMVCVCAYDAKPQNYIEIIDLDLRKGTHDLLLTHITTSDFRTRFWNPVICGPIACITTVSEKQASIHFIVNWETQSALYLKCRSAKSWQPSLVALIPGHIFVSLANRDQICLVSTDMLRAYWAPLNREQTIAVDDIPKLHTFEHSGNIEGMSVHESPLQRGSYRIYAFGCMYGGGRMARVRYKFAVDTGAGISAVPPPTQPVQLPLAKNLFSISYAGHCLVSDPPDQQLAIVPPAPGAAALRLEIVECHGYDGRRPQIARYGGTMIYCTAKSMIIEYYR